MLKSVFRLGLAFRATDLFPLPLTKAKQRVLRELESVYVELFNVAFEAIKEQRPRTSTMLHHLTYGELRKMGVPSQLIIEARASLGLTGIMGCLRVPPSDLTLEPFDSLRPSGETSPSP